MRHLIVLVAFLFAACDSSRSPRVNDMQVIGSHNSYKLAIDPPLMEMLRAKDSLRATQLDYSHTSLTNQLDLGLRILEIDVLYDPEGGRYANPLGIQLQRDAGYHPVSVDSLVMARPGFKVLHVPDLDFRTSCETLEACLMEILSWSEKNPNHVPIAITFNAKTSEVKDQPDFVKPLLFDKRAFDLMDEVLMDVLGEKVLKPDDVRGRYATLEESVLENGWPGLKDSRGKFILVLDEGGEKKETYLADHYSLKGRAMFVPSAPGNPESAFMIKNNPERDQEEIKSLVQRGYLVRTRSDAATVEAHFNDYSRFEAAVSSGAQYISTDYYLPHPITGFQVVFPDGGYERVEVER